MNEDSEVAFSRRAWRGCHEDRLVTPPSGQTAASSDLKPRRMRGKANNISLVFILYSIVIFPHRNTGMA